MFLYNSNLKNLKTDFGLTKECAKWNADGMGMEWETSFTGDTQPLRRDDEECRGRNNVEDNATEFIALRETMSSRIVSKDPNIPFAVDRIYVDNTIKIVSYARIWFIYCKTELMNLGI